MIYQFVNPIWLRAECTIRWCIIIQNSRQVHVEKFFATNLVSFMNDITKSNHEINLANIVCLENNTKTFQNTHKLTYFLQYIWGNTILRCTINEYLNSKRNVENQQWYKNLFLVLTNCLLGQVVYLAFSVSVVKLSISKPVRTKAPPDRYLKLKCHTSLSIMWKEVFENLVNLDYINYSKTLNSYIPK